MLIILTLLTVFAAVLLILVVLIQPGKADMVSGMGGFGGQMTNLLGVRNSRNILQSITMGLAIFIAVMAISINKFFLESEVVTKAPSTVGVEIPTNTAAPVQAPLPTTQPLPAQQQK